jgi:hypothetical protein
MYAVCLRPETQGPETTKEPIGIRQRVSHQAARASLEASRESRSRAVAGNLTLLKRVIEKSRGGGAATKGKADREDTGERFASVADGDDEGAHPLVLTADNQACHDESNLVDTEARIWSEHEPRCDAHHQSLDTLWIRGFPLLCGFLVRSVENVAAFFLQVCSSFDMEGIQTVTALRKKVKTNNLTLE